MTGRILIVDDMEPNIRVLTAKLEAEYYQVICAMNGEDAIEMARNNSPDLILLDVMMPVMDGFQTCRRLKNDPLTQHIPVVMVTALDGQQDRVLGLQAGADDFLSKPIDDIALFARVRSLLRLNAGLEELRSHLVVNQLADGLPGAKDLPAEGPGKLLIVEESQRLGQRIVKKLGAGFDCQIVVDQRQAYDLIGQGVDLVLVNLATEVFDGLRLCARIRADEATRHLPILCMVNPEEKDRTIRALDMGANDILERPVERHELRARVNTLLQRRLYVAKLRDSLDQSLEMAFLDQLTGLYNRRHMEKELQEIELRAQTGIEHSVIMMVDIDRFKLVNDTWGHQAGDMILQQVASYLISSFRAIDIVCRFGGEEFVVLMPGADMLSAQAAAERFRSRIEQANFSIGEDIEPIRITVSCGLAEVSANKEGISKSLSHADAALYQAKNTGRNRIVAASVTPHHNSLNEC